MTTDISISDGQWHTITLIEDLTTLRLLVDGDVRGYDIEKSAVISFMDPSVEKFIIGSVASNKTGN